MEYSNEEWSIDEDSLPEEKNSKLRWVWDKGMWLGKRIAVTGVAISSAPLVLPPLVALSALGVAFSVPFGLVFASYACTDKLMNSLLKETSAPSQPLMSDYEGCYVDDEEDGKADSGIRGYEDVESGYQEDEEEEDDVYEIEKGANKGVGMIDMVDEPDGDIKVAEEGLPMYDHAEVVQDINAEDVKAEEEGYEEDVAEFVEKGIKGAAEGMPLQREEGNELPANSSFLSANQGRGAPDQDSKRAGGETCREDLIGLQPPPRDLRVLPVSSGSTMSVPVEIVSLQEASASGDEEKIWEQINAIRTIIGCKEVPRTLAVDELKALYVLTGVEPPASAKDMKEKIHFLKNIIGVP